MRAASLICASSSSKRRSLRRPLLSSSGRRATIRRSRLRAAPVSARSTGGRLARATSGKMSGLRTSAATRSMARTYAMCTSCVEVCVIARMHGWLGLTSRLSSRSTRSSTRLTPAAAASSAPPSTPACSMSSAPFGDGGCCALFATVGAFSSCAAASSCVACASSAAASGVVFDEGGAGASLCAMRREARVTGSDEKSISRMDEAPGRSPSISSRRGRGVSRSGSVPSCAWWPMCWYA